MFTGLVEEVGELQGRDGGRFRFGARLVLEDVKIGDSLAVNGCCLTAVEVGDDWWRADVIEETLSRTNLGDLRPGDPVNYERPLRAADRLGGHVVLGHVDTVGTVVTAGPVLTVGVDEQWLRYIVAKGSVAVDGCSLTVVDALPDGFSVALVPHTTDNTTLGLRQPGHRVNVEFDVLAKYVERLVSGRGPDST